MGGRMNNKKTLTAKSEISLSSIEELNKKRELEQVRKIIRSVRAQISTEKIPVLERISDVVGGCPICLGAVILNKPPRVHMKLIVWQPLNNDQEFKLAQSGISELILSGQCETCKREIFVNLSPFNFSATNGIVNSSVDFSADGGILPGDKLLGKK